MKRTQHEIEMQIIRLEKLKDRLPAQSSFGDPNHEIIDAKVALLRGDMDEDEIEGMFGSDPDNEDNELGWESDVREAIYWLNGELDELMAEEDLAD